MFAAVAWAVGGWVGAAVLFALLHHVARYYLSERWALLLAAAGAGATAALLVASGELPLQLAGAGAVLATVVCLVAGLRRVRPV